MTETMANGYSSESTPRELSNEYQHDRASLVFENICILVLWMEVVSALEGLNRSNAEATFVQSSRIDAKIFEKHLNPVMLVLIG